MVTATAAQEPMLFVGRPGTAKSLLASVFCEALGLGEGEYFEYMLTKFTEPGEVLGPVDIGALKQGRYLRKTRGQLPEARVAFLDEVFKSNSALLNLLLTIINERKYYVEGTAVPVPLTMLFAASNEIPDFAEFDALKDRFVVKVEARSVKDDCFWDLIRAGVGFDQRRSSGEQPWRSDCSLDDFVVVHDYVVHSLLPQAAAREDDLMLGSETMTRAFRTLVAVLEDELGVEITDRKLIKLYKLIWTQAFVFGGGTITSRDLGLLRYCGNDFKDIRKIEQRLETVLEHLA